MWKVKLAKGLKLAADVLGPEEIRDPVRQKRFIGYSAMLGLLVGFVLSFLLFRSLGFLLVCIWAVSFALGWWLCSLVGAWMSQRIREARSRER
jgi:hypothetical protein